MGYLGLAVWMTVPRDDSELPSNGRCSERQFCFGNTAPAQWQALRACGSRRGRSNTHGPASPLQRSFGSDDIPCYICTRKIVLRGTTSLHGYRIHGQHRPRAPGRRASQIC